MFDSYHGSVNHPDWRELGWLTILGLMTGILGGVCAILFRFLIALFHNLAFFGRFSFWYDSVKPTAPSIWGAGYIIVPVIGAMIVAFLVRNFAPRARSHGVPEVMASIYRHGARIQPTLAVIKAVTSAISLGTGGSIGREGPIVQITSTVGSTLGTWLKFPPRVRTVLLAACAAGGVGASFDTPLGGVFFAVELFLPAVSAAALLPVSLSAVVATLLARQVFSDRLVLPIGLLPDFGSAALFDMLPALLLVGIAAGLVSTLFVGGLCRAESWFNGLAANYYIRHSFGMLLVGLEAYAFLYFTGRYYVEGLGYSVIFDLLTGGVTSLGFLLLLMAGKYVATCMTLGSGGSGGVFCPSFFLGAAAGALVYELLRPFWPDSILLSREVLVLTGMAASVGGTTGAVLSGIVMTSELTGNYQVLPATAIVAVVAFAIRRALIGGGIYTQKLQLRGAWIPEGLQSSVISSLHPGDLMVPIPDEGIPDHFFPVEEDMDMDAALRAWQAELAAGLVVMRQGRPVGIVTDRELGRVCRDMAERMI